MEHDVTVTLDRLRLVSRRFSQLQGLGVAFAGIVFTVVFGSYLIASPPEGRGGVWIALGIAMALIFPGERQIRRYYASAFGRARPTSSRLAIIWAAAIGLCMPIVDAVFTVPPPANVLLVAAGGALWIGLRDWPFRRHHLGAAVVCAAAFLLQTTAEAGRSPDLAVAAGFLSLGVVYVPIGFLDHRLLVSAMHGHPGGDRDGAA